MTTQQNTATEKKSTYYIFSLLYFSFYEISISRSFVRFFLIPHFFFLQTITCTFLLPYFFCFFFSFWLSCAGFFLQTFKVQLFLFKNHNSVWTLNLVRDSLNRCWPFLNILGWNEYWNEFQALKVAYFMPPFSTIKSPKSIWREYASGKWKMKKKKIKKYTLRTKKKKDKYENNRYSSWNSKILNVKYRNNKK